MAISDKEYVDFYNFWLWQYCCRNYTVEQSKIVEAGDYNGQYELYERHRISKFGFLVEYGKPINLYHDGPVAINPLEMMRAIANNEFIREDVCTIEEASGFKILGTAGAYTDSDGKIKGKVIAEMDFSLTTEHLVALVKEIKNKEYFSFPTKNFDFSFQRTNTFAEQRAQINKNPSSNLDTLFQTQEYFAAFIAKQINA